MKPFAVAEGLIEDSASNKRHVAKYAQKIFTGEALGQVLKEEKIDPATILQSL